MKKLILTVAIVCLNYFIFSQSCGTCRQSSLNYYKYQEYDKAKEFIDFCINCEKNKTDPRVWYYRGLIYQAIHVDKKYKALDPEAADKAFEGFKKALLYNFLDPTLQNLDIENKQEDLIKFYSALNDMKTKYTDQEITVDIIMNQFPLLANIFVNKGIDAYQNLKEYEKAYKYFSNSLFVSGLSGKIDTPVIYYAGLSAYKAKKYKEAKELFQTTIKLNYGATNEEKANVYYFLADVYKQTKDTQKYIETLKKGIEKYPNNNNLLVVELINYYLQSKQANEAKSYLEIAIKNDPNNATYYFALGTIYDNYDKDFAKAEEYYLKALNIKNDVFDYNYNLGALYYNKAADLYKAANEETDNIKYKKLKEQADENIKKSIPYLEKAHELDSKNLPTLESLKTAYYRAGMTEKYEQIKEKIKQLTQ
ncbi:MAG: tetratricopeptide repeat protein [Bacteroidales bacterium]|nr:tetratricopeptide repeat protein [Bacteroidales bacterium]